jgi:RNA polymerase sigma-70 factor (ECF subfamily)
MQRSLVERAQAGDHGAFAELTRATIGPMSHLAHLIVRDVELAEDATQEAFVAAWRDLPSLRDPDRFEAWLRRLLVRACYREAGRRRRRHQLELSDRPLSATTDDPCVTTGDHDELERLFRRLAPNQRAVLVLHHYLGYTLAEVADVLELPIGTVKSRLFRGQSSLRRALERDAVVAPANGSSVP